MAWQQPYVNIFKTCGICEWKKCRKEGDVVKVMDRTVKSSVYHINGQIPAANYIEFPNKKSSSLTLTGHFLYLLFKPVDGKFFSIHMDVNTSDNVVVRISLSNMFKDFKSTSTWLQFPVFSNPPKGSVDEVIAKQLNQKDQLGITSHSARWTLLCIDFQYILSNYLNKHYLFLKRLRLCSSLMVKSAFTSAICYQPGLNVTVARKTGLIASGVIPLPREMDFPLEKHDDWHKKYDYIKFPVDDQEKDSHENVIPGKAAPLKACSHTQKPQNDVENIKVRNIKQNETNSMIHRKVFAERIAYPAENRHRRNQMKSEPIIKQLPEVSLLQSSKEGSFSNDVHIYASSRACKYKGKENSSSIPAIKTVATKTLKTKQTLTPDPILRLKNIVGCGSKNFNQISWTSHDNQVVYPCHGLVVLYDMSTAEQSFLYGHTNTISSISFCPLINILASAQTGENSVIRIWKLNSQKCIAVFNSNLCEVETMSFSSNGNKLCAVGQDSNGRQIVSVWNTTLLLQGGKVSQLAKAHTELRSNNINCMKFVPFDDERLVSCGNHNIRIWRVKNSSLRSCPVDLQEYHAVEFTDFSFLPDIRLVEDQTNISIYLTTNGGSVYEVNYKSLTILNIHQLKGVGAELNSISAGSNFFAIGSDDGVLRLWTRNFKSVVLEAEHEDPVSIAHISPDNTKVLVGTRGGNLGVLDIQSKSYTTLTRSHVAPIISFSFEQIQNNIATVSEDNSIKIWDCETLNQVYDFQATDEKPTTICCHSAQASFACGFLNGAVRIFNLSTTSLILERKEHSKAVHCLLYNPNGEYLYSAGRDGSLVLYKSYSNSYNVLRKLTNVVAMQGTLANHTISINDNGQKLAVIGSTEFMITVFDAKSLDELLRIDITSMSCLPSKYLIDEAVGVCFTPSIIGHVLTITQKSRLLKFDCNNGQLMSEFSGLHNTEVTSICCSNDGKYIVTAGDACIKIWEYDMGKEFQVFIGHCSPIWRISFSPDNSTLISVGDTLFVWDFLGKQNPDANYVIKPKSYVHTHSNTKTKSNERDSLEKPRLVPPQPVLPSKELEFSIIDVDNKSDSVSSSVKSDLNTDAPGIHNEGKGKSLIIISDDDAEDVDDNDDDIDFHIERLTVNEKEQLKSKSESKLRQQPIQHPVCAEQVVSHHAPPNVTTHFKAKETFSTLAKKRYAAASHQAGMKLYASLGCHGNARNNVIWHPETGLFAYTSGCLVVLEDLNSGKQRLLQHHTEEISTLCVQNDGLVIASAESLSKSSQFGTIIIWFAQSGLCHKILQFHRSCVIDMKYSRDDRYLVSIGDYRECSFVVWCAQRYTVLAEKYLRYPIHSVQWNPYVAYQLTTVGRERSVLFWLLEDTNHEKMNLIVDEGIAPREVFQYDDDVKDMTSIAYANRHLLFTATSRGVVCAWRSEGKKCFMHWKADGGEISVLVARHGKLITGSVMKKLCLWNIPSHWIEEVNGESVEGTELVLENERKLDGSVVSASFDSPLEMGLVGTTNGTVWYINWEEEDDVRIVSGHSDKISSLMFCGGHTKYFVTSSFDGSVRLWNLETREQTAQFLVLGQGCCCVSFYSLPQELPSVVTNKTPLDYNTSDLISNLTITKQEHPSQCLCGYEDGTVRMFDFAKMEVTLKVKPHSDAVLAVLCSRDGRVIVSGCKGGLIAISDFMTGMTIRILTDHKNAPICMLAEQRIEQSNLWLASSRDRRISIWQSDWSKDLCELVDWISFPGHVLDRTNITDKKDKSLDIPPTLAFFHALDKDILIYTGYSVENEIVLYSLSKKQNIKSISISDWALSMDVSPCGHLLAVGFHNRLVKLLDIYSGTFQDFVGHSDSVETVRFTTDGKQLVTVAYTELLMWKILL